jgi:hypothetical protein
MIILLIINQFDFIIITDFYEKLNRDKLKYMEI